MDSWGRSREVEKPLSEMGVRERRAKLRERGIQEIDRLAHRIDAVAIILGGNSPLVTQLKETRDLLGLLVAEFSTEAKRTARDERERGDDDGVEYADPRDHRAGRE